MSNDKINKQIEIQHKYKNTFDNIINKTPYLKKLRDQSEGLKYKGDIISGDNSDQYKSNYDQIDWTATKNQKKNYRVKINGVYVDEEKDGN
jgi:hypothetical protein